jgi:hypothetical protein
MWATYAWFWARVALHLDTRKPPDHVDDRAERNRSENRLKVLRYHLPRVLGASAFGVIAIAYAIVLWTDVLSRKGGGVSWANILNLWILTIGFSLGTLLFYALVLYRRKWLPKRHERSSFFANLFAVDESPAQRYKGFRELPGNAKFFLLITIIFAIAAFMVATLWPVQMAGWFGPGFLLIFASTIVIPFGTILVIWSQRHGVPVLTFTVIAVALFSLSNNNHTVRVLDDPSGDRPGERPSIIQAFKNWEAQIPQATDRPPGQRIPIVIVATAGGASRAAYLTATILGRMEDEIPGFHRHVFAISGVSGGSLGAAAFQALLAASPGKKPTCVGEEGDISGYAKCGQRFLAQDFLGPVLAGLLYPDLAQRFLPVPFLPDRAQALERAWETAWSDVMTGTDLSFADRFSDLRSTVQAAPDPARPDTSQAGSSGGWLPLLFLNGTSVSTGSRIIAAQAKFDDKEIRDAADLLTRMGKEISLSTAVNMSTRFPYVEPAGLLLDTDGKIWDRVVDGGYFENFGATTAYDILATLRSKVAKFDMHYRPIVVQISNDSGYQGVDAADKVMAGQQSEEAKATAQRDFLSELTDPPIALAETRGARGRYAVNAIDRTLSETRIGSGEGNMSGDQLGEFIEFRIFQDGQAKDPPLAWRMSEAAMLAIGVQVEGDAANNKDKFIKLRNAIVPTAPAIQARQGD